MLGPEQIARVKIDSLLSEAGWVLQNRDQFNKSAALGVAVGEFSLPAGPCDYLLFIEGKAAGVIEAKKTGVTLSGVAEQSQKYMARLPDHLARWDDTLRFDYEGTGDETFFRDMRDPKPRSRRLFAFHKPETLLACPRRRSRHRNRSNAIRRSASTRFSTRSLTFAGRGSTFSRAETIIVALTAARPSSGRPKKGFSYPSSPSSLAP